MRKLFLTSSVNFTAKHLTQYLGFNPKGKKLLFIDTAAEGEPSDDKQWLVDDHQALVDIGFKVSDYTLTGKTQEEIKKTLNEAEVIFVSGGNTFYLLEKIQLSKSAKLFAEEIAKGKVYIGSSAGSVIAGPDISLVKRLDIENRAPNLKGYQGLGLVDFTVLPHWGSDYFRELYLNKRLEDVYGMKHKLILLTDNQYVYVEGETYRILDREKD